MSNRNFPRSKGQAERKVHNLNVIYESTAYKMC
jgi:hypothetical protein